MSMQISTSSWSAQAEKTGAAGSSVAAALFLTGLKIVVGLATNSLGILAEAAHSGLDLGAALMTLFAVRVSDQPADEKHPFGHARVENLSALFETLLLLITCVWIVWESVRRLFLEREAVEASIWAFLAMAVSIIVDVSRSRMLRRAARKHDSQALEADALHFETDIWSSAVVLLGLSGVWVAQRQSHLAWLESADAVAALGVAVIVIGVSIRLGGRAVRCLLDGTEPAAVRHVRDAIQSTPGVMGFHQLRVRTAGPQTFVDVHILADRRASLWEAHALADAVHDAVRAAAPRTDIVVHVEPAPRAAPKSIVGEVSDADR
jgi:cation diffusion facilitator family transporter